MRKTSNNVPSSQLPAGSLLFVLSGPSGAGKDAVLSRLKQAGSPLEYITTVTTRTKRATENDGVDYHFISEQKFQEMLAGNELLESASVYGNWYGVPRKPVEQGLAEDRDVIVKVDIQGAATIRGIFPQAVSIFLVPPLMEELVNRLEQRHTESSFDLDLRINTAEDEMTQLPMFDYVVYNRKDKIDSAVEDIEAIIRAEKCRVKPRIIGRQNS